MENFNQNGPYKMSEKLIDQDFFKILDRKTDKVTSLQIVNWTSRESDEAIVKRIDEVM